MKKIFFILIASILVSSLAFATAHENFTEAKKLIEEKVSCNNLTNEQIEEMGDYLMELMHPGESHEQMHNIMGGEDSETVKLMHINMAKMMYCDNGEGMNNMMSMMGNGRMNMNGNMMSRMMGGGMMSGGMMGNNYYQNPQNNSIYPNSLFGFQIFFYMILILIIITLVLVIMLLINKSRNSSKQKGGNMRR